MYNKNLNSRIFYISASKAINYGYLIESVSESGEVTDGLFKNLCRKANNNFELNARQFLYSYKRKLIEYLNTNNQESLCVDNYKFKIQNDKIFYATSDSEKYSELTEKIVYKGFENGIGPRYRKSKLITDLNSSFDNLKLKHKHLNPLDKYVVIIDNVENMSLVEAFGDVYNLLDVDSRRGQRSAKKINLRISGETFFVPDNIHIIASTNKLVKDIDVELLDLFNLHQVLPDLSDLHKIEIGKINLEEFVKNFNENIEYVLGEDYIFGERYFEHIDSFDDLKLVFSQKIIPILKSNANHDLKILEKIIGGDFFDYSKDKSFMKLKSHNNWTQEMFVI